MFKDLLLLIVIGSMLVAINKNPKDKIENGFKTAGYLLMVFAVWLTIIKIVHDFILTILI